MFLNIERVTYFLMDPPSRAQTLGQRNESWRITKGQIIESWGIKYRPEKKSSS